MTSVFVLFSDFVSLLTLRNLFVFTSLRPVAISCCLDISRGCYAIRLFQYIYLIFNI